MSQRPHLPRQSGERHLILGAETVPTAHAHTLPTHPIGTFVECESLSRGFVKGIIVGTFWTSNCYTYVVSCYNLGNDCVCARDQDFQVIQDKNKQLAILKKTLLGKSPNSPVHKRWRIKYAEAYQVIKSFINECKWSVFTMY